MVTGGSGFIGTAVIAHLAARGHPVVATTTRPGPHLDRSAHWVVWDALVEPVPAVEWGAIDVIVHLALPRKPHTGPDKRRAIFETSVVATFHLLESARRYGIGRVLVASTGDALGATGCAQEDDECHRPASFYGTAKACEELVARCRDDTVASGILRFFHPYGPGGEAYLVNRLLRQVIAGERIEIEEPNGIDLNPVWIDDLATGICLAVESRHGGIFHFAGPETVTLRALVELSGEISRREPRVQLRKGHVRGGHAGDFRRAARVLGYRPAVGVREGVSALLAATA